MTFKPEFSLGDLIAAAGFLMAALGLFLTLWQLWQDSKRKRAEFIVSVFHKYTADPEAAKMFYSIDYGQFRYGPEFHNSPEERMLDLLLSYFEKIAVLHRLGVITLKDLNLIKYEFIRIYRNNEVKKYFEYLDRLRTGINISGKNFEAFRSVAALLDAPENRR